MWHKWQQKTHYYHMTNKAKTLKKKNLILKIYKIEKFNEYNN